MQFTSKLTDGIRIEAVATDSSQGGFHACIYLRDEATDGLLWFEEDLAGGFVFATAEQALEKALKAGWFRARKLIVDRDSVSSR